MKPVSLVIALIATAAAVAGIVMLITNVSGACVAAKSLLGTLLFVVGSVAAAHCWVKGLNLTIKPNIKYTSL